jgi:hypothetical protein
MTDANKPVTKSHRIALEHLQRYAAARAAVEAQVAAWAPNAPEGAAHAPVAPPTEETP